MSARPPSSLPTPPAPARAPDRRVPSCPPRPPSIDRSRTGRSHGEPIDIEQFPVSASRIRSAIRSRFNPSSLCSRANNFSFGTRETFPSNRSLCPSVIHTDGTPPGLSVHAHVRHRNPDFRSVHDQPPFPANFGVRASPAIRPVSRVWRPQRHPLQAPHCSSGDTPCPPNS